MSLRVIMFPAVGNRHENRYIDIVVGALRRSGITVIDWHKHMSLQTGDIFHVHWPDLIADIWQRPLQRARGELIFRNLLATIRRVKRHGGKIAWTVHDLRPHDGEIDGLTFNSRVMQSFIGSVDLVFSLTESGKSAIIKAFPPLSRVPVCLARHPHYRDVVPSRARTEDIRRRLGIAPNQRVYSLLGSMRPDKRPELVSQAFSTLPPDDAFLIMAGACEAKLAAALSADLVDNKNKHLSFSAVPASELHDLYSVTDISLFPSMSYFNSGTIYTALSSNVPVIAVQTPQTLELQALVGERWLYLYDGNLSADILLTGARHIVGRSQGMSCDLSMFDPDVCARQHIDAYRKILT